MDLLRVQDTLKNASDQQLMQMMQAPDSTAPSYLVLSEIRRRKDMRDKQVPDDGSRSTVAEDLTAPDSHGIRDIQMPEQAPPDMDDQAGIEAMREGGVVRMQAGGPAMGMSASDPVIFGRPLSSYSLEELERLTPGRAIRGVAGLSPASAVRRFDEETGEPIASNQQLIQRRIASLRSRTEQPFPEQEAIRESLPSIEPAGIRDLAPQPAPLMMNAPQQQPALPARTPARSLPEAAQGPVVVEGQNQPRPAPMDAQPRPSAAAPSDATPASSGAPTFAGIFRENEPLFSDGIAGLRERAREERVDPEARRNQAVNMALIEAGLRMASSRNPSFMGAIGEGALPAVQSYNQQLGQIRTEQRDARRDEMEMAKQELNRQFSIGQISAAQYRTQMDNVNANMRAASSERALNIRTAAGEAGASSRAQAAMNLERLRAENRPVDVSGIPALIAETGREIRDVRTRLAALGPRPTEIDSRGRPNPLFQNWVASGGGELASQLQELERQRGVYQGMFTSARPGLSAPTPPSAPGVVPLPSGARIENGRYIPAGS